MQLKLCSNYLHAEYVPLSLYETSSYVCVHSALCKKTINAIIKQFQLLKTLKLFWKKIICAETGSEFRPILELLNEMQERQAMNSALLTSKLRLVEKLRFDNHETKNVTSLPKINSWLHPRKAY